MPVSPIQHLEDRKYAIYDNLRDLQFEYRLGKLSDDDYQQTKQALQKELAVVLAETEANDQEPGSASLHPAKTNASCKLTVGAALQGHFAAKPEILRRMRKGHRHEGSFCYSFFLRVSSAASIDGTVINGTTGKPQAGVSVTLVKPGQQGMQTIGDTVTDASGHFVFEKDRLAAARSFCRPSTRASTTTN